MHAVFSFFSFFLFPFWATPDESAQKCAQKCMHCRGLLIESIHVVCVAWCVVRGALQELQASR